MARFYGSAVEMLTELTNEPIRTCSLFHLLTLANAPDKFLYLAMYHGRVAMLIVWERGRLFCEENVAIFLESCVSFE